MMNPEEFIRRVIDTLAYRYPLLYSVLAQLDILLVPDLIGETGAIAATDGARIFIDASIAEELARRRDGRSTALLLAHEAIHALLQHPARIRLAEARGVASRTALVAAADAKVDQHLRMMIGVGNDDKMLMAVLAGVTGIRLEPVTVESVARMLAGRVRGDPRLFVERSSVEEIAKLIDEAKASALMKNELITVEEGDALESRGVRVRAGRMSRQLRQALGSVAAAVDTGSFVEALEMIGEAMAGLARSVKALASVASSIAARAGGRRTGEGEGLVERLLGEVAKGVVDWKRVLRRMLLSLANPRRVERSWARLNKKLPDARPGVRSVGGISKIVAAVDVSGSIDEIELRLFIGAVLDAVSALRPREATIVYWDYGVRRVVRVKGARVRMLARLAESIPGGGGTSISEALEVVGEEVRKPSGATLVVIASDFYTTEDVGRVAQMIDEIASTPRVTVATIVPPSGMVPPVQRAVVIRLPGIAPWERVGA